MIAHKAEGKRSARARLAAALGAVTAVVAMSGPMPAANTPIRLVGVSSQGNAVLIEASEPVAYSVSRPDPLTLLIDMRNVSTADARNDVRRHGAVASVQLEQATAFDGRAVARVRVSLARQAAHKVRAARNLIRVELTPTTAAAAPAPVSELPLPASRDSAPANPGGAAAKAGQQPAAKPAVPLAPPPDPMSALQLVAPPIERTRATRDATRSAQGPEAARTPAPATSREPRAEGEQTAPPPAAAPAPPQPASQVMKQPASPPAPQAQSSRQSPAQGAPGQPAQEPPAQSAPPRPAPQTAPAPAARVAPPDPLPRLSSSTPQVGTTTQQKTYTGHPISLDFTGGDLRTVLRLFAEVSGLNIIIDPDVQGSVDIVLTDVPWDQALDVILRANQLDYTVDGTIVRIARIETLRREQEARQALAKAQADAGTLAVRTFPLSYARAADAAPLVRKAALSARGDVQIDERTNMLIITDLPARLQTAETLLVQLDKPEPQVEIEARIVSTDRDFSRAIGVEWGLNGRVSPQLGNTTGLAFPNNGSIGGRTGGTQGPQGTDVRADPNNQTGTAVTRLPFAPVGAVGLALGSVNGAFNLDVALSAAEASGKVRILSTPRVTTQNNVAAEMMQGVQIPVQTVANNTVTVSFKDAALTLRVTPQITAAETVIMAVEVENATPGQEVQGIPSINTQRARTTVQVADGATTIIGGVLINTERENESRVPGLHQIPLLGWLFKSLTSEDNSRELLIFITPRILKG